MKIYKKNIIFYVSFILILLSPFLSNIILIIPLLLLIYRYTNSSKTIFLREIIFLTNFGSLFLITGFGSGLSTIIVFGTLVIIYKESKFIKDSTFYAVLLLVTYLLFRSNGRITDFVFISSAILLIYTSLKTLTIKEAVRLSKIYVYSLISSSFYGYIFRGTSALEMVLSPDSIAATGMENALRFRGLFLDSNYFSFALLLGLVLLMQLLYKKHISFVKFLLIGTTLVYFGALTYSRTFFIIFSLLILYANYLLWKLKKPKVAIMTSMIFFVFSFLVITGQIPVFDVVLQRLNLTQSLSSLTASRDILLLSYWEVITSSFSIFLFGKGLSADLIGGIGPHNIYIETVYHLGILGLFIYIALFVYLRREILKKSSSLNKTEVFLASIPVFLFILTFISLQGIFNTFTYLLIFIVFSSYLNLSENKNA